MPFFGRLRAALVAALLASQASTAAPVSAQAPSVLAVGEPPLRVTWDSDDPACSGDDVSARALHMVGPGVVPRPLRANVEVRHEGAEWRVRLQTQSGNQSGRRILRAESCDELRQAIALLLAMAMESRGDVLPPDPPPPAAPEPAPSPPIVVPTPAEPTEPARDRPGDEGKETSNRGPGIGWFVRLDGKAAHGLTPGLGLGAGVTAGIRVGDVDVGVSAAYWTSSRADASDRPGYINLSRQDIGLRACWNVWRLGGLTLAPCIAPELTFFRWESKQVWEPEADIAGPLTSVTAGIDLRYALVADRVSILLSPGLTLERVQPFEIRLRPDGSPANQPSTVPPEPVEIYRTERFGPRLELGVDARF